ncbi:MAG: DUF4331 family protein [Pyrinomonadaceae bacterium]|nr:DUF4331 family protein [Pyrinomonadaceae bacterium]
MRFVTTKPPIAALVMLLVITLVLVPATKLDAADHGDAPLTAHDLGADLNDAYMFLDPNDNTRVIMIMTVHGFIAPGENSNFGIFDPALRYRFEIETTGDAKPDRFIDVRFSPRVANAAGVPQAQTATISLPNGRTFTAPSTNSNNAADVAPTPVLFTDSQTGVIFFAGLTDDPFFFDIPAFARFNGSIRAGTPNPGVFSRGRDTFAGYNTLAIAFSMPLSFIRGPGNELGLACDTQRRSPQFYNSRTGEIAGAGRWVNVDREGVPAVNVALVPFNLKNTYNAANSVEDANGRFAPGIVDTLQNFYRTDATSIGILAGVAVTRGDILRLDLTVPNTGTNPQASFPNGRRLTDDVIDILLTLINNRQPLGDSVNGNDLPFRSTFPFLAPSQQPRAPGTLDDNTRN